MESPRVRVVGRKGNRSRCPDDSEPPVFPTAWTIHKAGYTETKHSSMLLSHSTGARDMGAQQKGPGGHHRAPDGLGWAGMLAVVRKSGCGCCSPRNSDASRDGEQRKWSTGKKRARP